MIQRRAERDDVADGADDQAFLVAELGELGPERAGRIEGRFGVLVGDEFQRADQTDAARFADERMIGEAPALAPPLELRRPAAPRRRRDRAPR